MFSDNYYHLKYLLGIGCRLFPTSFNVKPRSHLKISVILSTLVSIHNQFPVFVKSFC